MAHGNIEFAGNFDFWKVSGTFHPKTHNHLNTSLEKHNERDIETAVERLNNLSVFKGNFDT